MKKKVMLYILLLFAVGGIAATAAFSFSVPFFGAKMQELKPENGIVSIPLKDVSDGKAHFFKVKAEDGVMVIFFVLKSSDGVIRAAIDACDVCYRAGKGYVQEGDFMICENCGQRFASNRINEVKGGCNPAPLDRKVVDDTLQIAYKDINTNSWYCRFKK